MSLAYGDQRYYELICCVIKIHRHRYIINFFFLNVVRSRYLYIQNKLLYHYNNIKQGGGKSLKLEICPNFCLNCKIFETKAVRAL